MAKESRAWWPFSKGKEKTEKRRKALDRRYLFLQPLAY